MAGCLSACMPPGDAGQAERGCQPAEADTQCRGVVRGSGAGRPACAAITSEWIASGGQVPPTPALLPGLTSSGLRIYLHISPPQARLAHAPRAVCCRHCRCAMSVIMECEVGPGLCSLALLARGCHDVERRSKPLCAARDTVYRQRPQAAGAASSTGVGEPQTSLHPCHSPIHTLNVPYIVTVWLPAARMSCRSCTAAMTRCSSPRATRPGVRAAAPGSPTADATEAASAHASCASAC